MSQTNKSSELIPRIITATSKQESIEILTDALKMLHLTSDYTALVALKDKLDEYKQTFREIKNKYKVLETPRFYTQVHEIRVELDFLYQDVVDDLSFEVNKLKIYWGDDRRSEIRATSVERATQRMEKEAEATGTKKPSHSLVMDMFGKEDTYKEFLNYKAMSYGTFKELTYLLTAITSVTNSLSSESKWLMNIENKNA